MSCKKESGSPYTEVNSTAVAIYCNWDTVRCVVLVGTDVELECYRDV